MSKKIDTPNAPAAIGPFSQAIEANGMVFVSGQLPIDPNTGVFAGSDIVSQVKQSLTNIASVLKEAGLEMSDVVKTTVLLQNMSDFTAMNEVYASFFKEPYPARAAFEVVKLPKGALVEIEVIAVKEEDQ